MCDLTANGSRFMLNRIVLAIARAVRPVLRGLPACALCALVLLPAPLRGQATEAEELLAAGDELHLRLRPLEALEAYQALLARDSTHPGALWRAAREAVNLGMLTADPGARTEWYASAVAYGRRAVGADSTDVEGWTWLAIALGRSTLDEGPRTRVRLAEEVRAAGLRALELDSASAAAHHVLGEWHAEIRRLNGLTRFAARTLLGAGTFDLASWDEAESHLQRAVELEPEGLIHHLALARLLLDRDRSDEARVHLEEVLERPAREPTDARHKQDAQELLRSLAGLSP